MDNNKVLLCSTGKYIQYPGINHNRNLFFFRKYMCQNILNISSIFKFLFKERYIIYRVPWRFSGKESACQCRRHGFDLWVRKIRRRKWQSTPVFLPGKSHGQRSLAGYSPWGHKRIRHDLVTKQHTHTHTHTCLCAPIHILKCIETVPTLILSDKL